MVIDTKLIRTKLGLESGQYLGKITETGEVKFGEKTIAEKISEARRKGATDSQVVSILSRSNWGVKIDEAKGRGATDVQILNSFIRKETLVTPTKKEGIGIIRTIIKEEMGAVESITAPLFFKAAESAVQKEREAQDKLAQLYKTLPEGSYRDRLGKMLEKYVEEGPVLRFEEIVPTAAKSTSQALGEAVMLGLLIAPAVPGIKALLTTKYIGVFGKQAATLATTNIIKDFYKNLGKGMATGAAMGATIGIAQEGELKEKVSDIAIMTGIGAIGGGVLAGVLPPVVKLVGGGIRNIFSKVVGKLDDKIITPVIRYIERPIEKLKVKKAIQAIGVNPIEKNIDNLNERITKLYYKIDDMFYSAKTRAEMVPTAKKIRSLQRQVVKIENKRTKLLNETIFKDLTPGDKIFHKDIGIFRVKEFRADLGGKMFVLGEDVNGRIVTITPDDLLKMKKILPQHIMEKTEIVGLPKLLEQPVELNKTHKVLFGVRSLLQTTSKMVNKMGNSGKTIVKMLDQSIDIVDRRIGKYQNDMGIIIRRYGLTKKPFTSTETKNIIDILDSGIRFKARTLDDIPIKPINNRVKDFLDVFTKTTIEVGEEFDSLGGRIKTPGKQYHTIVERYIHLPHIPKDINKLKAAAPDIVENILVKRHKLTPRQANETLNNFIKQYYARRYSGLEMSRTLLIEGYDELAKYGYEINPMTIFNDFVNGSVKRVEDIRMFGKSDEVMARLINQVGIDGYDKGLVQKVWNTVKGDVVSSSHKELANAIKTWQVVGKLPLASIANATQTVNTASEFGVKRTFKAFGKFMTDRVGTEEAAKLAGVKDALITRAMEMAGAESKTAGTFLRKVGFTSVEKFNRYVTVLASQDWATDALKILQKNPDDIKLLRHFRNLGFDDDAIRKILQRGRFTQDELSKVGQKAVQSTQFRGSVLDTPLLWSSDAGKVATQFKSFAWQQGAFVKRAIVDEAAQGNVAPLITYTIMSQITGEAVRDIRDVLKGDFDFRQDEDTISRLIDNQLTVGGFGLAGDLFYSMFERSKGKIYITAADFVGGPTVGEITDFVDGVADMFGGRFSTITGWATRDFALLSLIPGLKKIPGSGVILRILGDILRTIQRKTD